MSPWFESCLGHFHQLCDFESQVLHSEAPKISSMIIISSLNRELKEMMCTQYLASWRQALGSLRRG